MTVFGADGSHLVPSTVTKGHALRWRPARTDCSTSICDRHTPPNSHPCPVTAADRQERRPYKRGRGSVRVAPGRPAQGHTVDAAAATAARMLRWAAAGPRNRIRLDIQNRSWYFQTSSLGQSRGNNRPDSRALCGERRCEIAD